MKNQISKLLDITPEVYDNVVFSNYMKWCNAHAKSDLEVQRLLTSPALANWWMQEYHKLEMQFIERAQPYQGKLDSIEMKRFYHDEMLQIHRYFSKPLVYCAKNKRQVITPNPMHN